MVHGDDCHSEIQASTVIPWPHHPLIANWKLKKWKFELCNQLPIETWKNQWTTNSSSEQEGRARVAAKRDNTWCTFGGSVLRKMCLLTVTAIRQRPKYIYIYMYIFIHCHASPSPNVPATSFSCLVEVSHMRKVEAEGKSSCTTETFQAFQEHASRI